MYTAFAFGTGLGVLEGAHDPPVEVADEDEDGIADRRRRDESSVESWPATSS